MLLLVWIGMLRLRNLLRLHVLRLPVQEDINGSFLVPFVVDKNLSDLSTVKRKAKFLDFSHQLVLLLGVESHL